MTANLRLYPVMKETNIERLGDVPIHWKVTRLKTHLIRNDSGVWGNDFHDEGTVVLRSTEQTASGGWMITSPARINLSSSEIASTLLKSGDLVVTKSSGSQAHIGKTSLVDDEIEQMQCCFSNFMQRLRLDQSTVPAFVWRNLNSPVGREQLVFQSTTTTGLGNLNGTILGNCRFAFPPLPEQTAIVRYLDYVGRRIQRFVRAKEKLIELLSEQKRAIIHQVVTGQVDVRTGQPYPAYKPSGVEWLGDVPEHWETRRLRSITEMRVSNVDKHVKENETPVRLCNYVDVYKSDHINAQMNFMEATATPDEIDHFRLEEGDVLITKDSETWNDIGVPALVTDTATDLVSGYHLALLRPHTNKLTGGYLHRALQSKGLAYQFHIAANGVTRYGLSHSGIKSVQLPLPLSLSEQHAIVKYLDKTTADIDTAITRARREIELVNEYRTRLIADVVTGKLDVREAAAKLPDDPEPSAENDLANGVGCETQMATEEKN